MVAILTMKQKGRDHQPMKMAVEEAAVVMVNTAHKQVKVCYFLIYFFYCCY